jgi:DAPG hydrolase PhiG domain
MATYLGYHQDDHKNPYGKYFNEKMRPIPPHAEEALARSPFPSGTLPSVESVSMMTKAGYAQVENGYCLENDGSIRVAIRTDMPGVSPQMWDWWFAWHGSQAGRYKLWHPLAHQDAKWKDGGEDFESYVGRTSQIEEYIGKSFEKAAIRFLSPVELGIASEQTQHKQQSVFICARVGYRDYPIDFGWLAHHVRATETGSEMRSRFWMGGAHIQSRIPGLLPRLFVQALANIIRLPKQRGIDLLTHCSEEMNHLAGFLPELYAEFAHKP